MSHTRSSARACAGTCSPGLWRKRSAGPGAPGMARGGGGCSAVLCGCGGVWRGVWRGGWGRTGRDGVGIGVGVGVGMGVGWGGVLGGGAPERLDRLDHFRRKLAQHHRRDLPNRSSDGATETAPTGRSRAVGLGKWERAKWERAKWEWAKWERPRPTEAAPSRFHVLTVLPAGAKHRARSPVPRFRYRTAFKQARRPGAGGRGARGLPAATTRAP
jgi:hypothetical protein